MPGSVRRRGKYYTVVVDIGPDPETGRRRQVRRSVKGPKREAEELAVRLLHQRDRGVDLRPERITVGGYLERWLRDYAGRNVAPTTLLRYRELVRLHLAPLLGSIPLTRLLSAHVEAAYRHLHDKGLASQTVLHAHRVLKEALGHAVRGRLLPYNACDAVKAPRVERRQVAALAVDQVQALLDAAGQERQGAIVRVAILTGLRRGELLGLRWADVDLDEELLRVRQVAQKLPGQGFVFRQPKTHRSVRPVAISPALVFLLRRQRAQQAERRLTAGPLYRDQDLVFADDSGDPLRPTAFRGMWRRLTRRAGVEGIRFHDLRHAHASLMLVQGAHPKVVSERLGHSGIGITLDTYSHLLPHLQAEAAAGLDRLLGLDDPRKL